MTGAGLSRQRRKTRAAILEAFGELVLQRRFADIRIADIIRRADIGRSTFYEHFRNKDDVFRQSVSAVLSVVAEAVELDCDTKRLQFMLDHFQDNSRWARGLLNGPSCTQVSAVLAGLVEKRLAALPDKLRSPSVLPLRLAAAQTAEGLLGLVRAWLNDGAGCSSAAIASALHKSATALTRALLEGR
jgi:AcrR family transcriptional regulator